MKTFTIKLARRQFALLDSSIAVQRSNRFYIPVADGRIVVTEEAAVEKCAFANRTGMGFFLNDQCTVERDREKVMICASGKEKENALILLNIHADREMTECSVSGVEESQVIAGAMGKSQILLCLRPNQELTFTQKLMIAETQKREEVRPWLLSWLGPKIIHEVVEKPYSAITCCLFDGAELRFYGQNQKIEL